MLDLIKLPIIEQIGQKSSAKSNLFYWGKKIFEKRKLDYSFNFDV